MMPHVRCVMQELARWTQGESRQGKQMPQHLTHQAWCKRHKREAHTSSRRLTSKEMPPRRYGSISRRRWPFREHSQGWRRGDWSGGLACNVPWHRPHLSRMVESLTCQARVLAARIPEKLEEAPKRRITMTMMPNLVNISPSCIFCSACATHVSRHTTFTCKSKAGELV